MVLTIYILRFHLLFFSAYFSWFHRCIFSAFWKLKLCRGLLSGTISFFPLFFGFYRWFIATHRARSDTGKTFLYRISLTLFQVETLGVFSARSWLFPDYFFRLKPYPNRTIIFGSTFFNILTQSCPFLWAAKTADVFSLALSYPYQIPFLWCPKCPIIALFQSQPLPLTWPSFFPCVVTPKKSFLGLKKANIYQEKK